MIRLKDILIWIEENNLEDEFTEYLEEIAKDGDYGLEADDLRTYENYKEFYEAKVKEKNEK